jgi:hypothetical protein
MPGRKLVSQMSDSEFAALVKALSRDGLEYVIHFLRGWTPEGTEAALEFAERMRPPGVIWCPAFTDVDDTTVYCDRDPGHPGSHHAPGPDEGSEVAWGDAPEGNAK